MTNREIGRRITMARERCGMNKKELAEKTKVSPSTITRYENGDFERVKIAILESIAKATGVNPMWLSGNSEVMEERSSASGYYFNEETAKMAQELFENKDMRVLFSAARGSTPDSLKSAAVFLAAMKEKEGYNGDDPA